MKRYSNPEALPVVVALLERARAASAAAARSKTELLDALREVGPVKAGDVVKRGTRIYKVVEVRLDHIPRAGEPIPFRYLCKTREGRFWTGAKVILPADVEVVPAGSLPLMED